MYKTSYYKGVFRLGKMYIEERAICLAHYIIDNKDTVRGAAKKFGVSKSTVHKDVSERLLKINPILLKKGMNCLNKKLYPYYLNIWIRRILK